MRYNLGREQINRALNSHPRQEYMIVEGDKEENIVVKGRQRPPQGGDNILP
jgi:hypothetical protein